jgi:hypothetical protein
MSRKALLTMLALTVVLTIGVAEPSLAATDIGKNVGDEIGSWAKGLLLGVAALVGLPALFRRDVGQGVVILLIVVLIGGFVYAGGPVQSTIKTMWQTVAGTTPDANTKGKGD